MYLIVGLGNPGEEYENTRHNIGRMAELYVAGKAGATSWKGGTKNKALSASGEIAGKNVKFIVPTTYMNHSGNALRELIKNPKAAEKVIVIYDDMDLPLGTVRLAQNRGSGGHNGVESIIKALKTKAFIRVRIGASPTTPGGKLRKPQGDKGVVDFLMGNINAKEKDTLKKSFKQVYEAIETIIKEGIAKAMNEHNR